MFPFITVAVSFKADQVHSSNPETVVCVSVDTATRTLAVHASNL